MDIGVDAKNMTKEGDDPSHISWNQTKPRIHVEVHTDTEGNIIEVDVTKLPRPTEVHEQVRRRRLGKD